MRQPPMQQCAERSTHREYLSRHVYGGFIHMQSLIVIMNCLLQKLRGAMVHEPLADTPSGPVVYRSKASYRGHRAGAAPYPGRKRPGRTMSIRGSHAGHGFGHAGDHDERWNGITGILRRWMAAAWIYDGDLQCTLDLLVPIQPACDAGHTAITIPPGAVPAAETEEEPAMVAGRCGEIGVAEPIPAPWEPRPPLSPSRPDRTSGP